MDTGIFGKSPSGFSQIYKGPSNASMFGGRFGSGIPPNGNSPQFPFMAGRGFAPFSGMGFPAPNGMSREASSNGAFFNINPTKIGSGLQSGSGFIPTMKTTSYAGLSNKSSGGYIPEGLRSLG